MPVLTHFGADLRRRHRPITLVLLSVLLCSPTAVVGADTNHNKETAQHFERFAFTGTYRFWLTPTAKSPTGPIHDRPDRHEMPEAPPIAIVEPIPTSSHITGHGTTKSAKSNLKAKAAASATTQPPTEDSKAEIASANPAPGYIALRKIKNASVDGSIAPAPQTMPNTRNKAPLSRDTRSSLGVTPSDQPNAVAKEHAPGQVTAASQVALQQQSGSSPADAITKPAQARLPMVRIAVSTPATSTNAGEPQAITLAPTGRIINVPPLPAKYQRPAGASRTRNNGFASTSKRIVKRTAAPQNAKSVKPNPYSIYARQPDWANNTLFKTDKD